MIIKNVRLATTVFLSIQTLNKCLCCNKDHQYKFDKKLMELFFNTYKFSNLDNNKFTLLFQKSVYSYQYMDDWEKLNQTSLPEKKNLRSYKYGRSNWCKLRTHKRVCKGFDIKDLQKYHDFYIESDKLLSPNVFKTFRNMCIKIYKLDPAKFLSAPGLGCQVAALKRTKVKLDLLTDIDMLLMVEKGIRGICNSTYWYAKANNKSKKDYDKNKESSYL